MTDHVLYKTDDLDAPKAILDSNGEVVLGMCRVCKRAEVELDEPCTGLLPCPFCGSKDVDPEGWYSSSADDHGPACNECEGSCDTVDRWNNRPTPLKTAAKFPRGTKVYKSKGHEFIGEYLIEFDTIKGERRCVCECTAPGAGGMLYVLRPEQLEKRDE